VFSALGPRVGVRIAVDLGDGDVLQLERLGGIERELHLTEEPRL
jgi:hypothetical protein